jgi:hypothetical protein
VCRRITEIEHQVIDLADESVDHAAENRSPGGQRRVLRTGPFGVDWVRANGLAIHAHPVTAANARKELSFLLGLELLRLVHGSRP